MVLIVETLHQILMVYELAKTCTVPGLVCFLDSVYTLGQGGPEESFLSFAFQ